jgi:hypothetical protein
MTVSVAPSCGVTYDCRPDDSSGVFYNSKICITQAAGVTEDNRPDNFQVFIYIYSLN